MPHRDLSPADQHSTSLSTVAARMTCWVWGCLAIISAVALVVLFGLNRLGIAQVPQSLLFRLVVLVWSLLPALGLAGIPGLDFDGRLLSYYTNRDFDDAFLAGSAVLAFVIATAALRTADGLNRGHRWAFRCVGGLSWLMVTAVAAYGVWYVVRGAPTIGLAVVATAGSVPVALGFASFRHASRPGLTADRPAGRRNPLTRPTLLLLLSAHAILMAPVFACVWILLGILMRRTWLNFVS